MKIYSTQFLPYLYFTFEIVNVRFKGIGSSFKGIEILGSQKHSSTFSV